MSLTKIILGYVLTAIVFFGIDLIWLGVVAKDLYKKHLGFILSDKVNWTAALIFYFLFIIGIFIFAINPAIKKDSVWQAMLLGALFGFFTYSTYDLTNLATLKDWPLKIVFIDIAWGSFLTTAVSIAGFYILKMLN
ncbi:MAG: DUF2177 family protein [Bacteroidales bacterium]|nr:DUF2177 family protein [Bacteroidales bacterium]MCF8404504.1 DUF2177 family protein [Bacteroidales bacterium]